MWQRKEHQTGVNASEIRDDQTITTRVRARYQIRLRKDFIMASKPSSTENNGQKTVSATPASAEEYKVGPGRPPREYMFKKGQSGNPKGAKRRPPSLLPNLKRLFEQALSEKVTLKQGEKQHTL